MRILLSLFLLLSVLKSDTIIKHSGSLDYSLSEINDHSVNTVDLIYNTDIYFDNSSKLVVSPGIFTNDGRTYNSVVKQDVDSIQEIYINELYFSKALTEELTISLGIFPFRKGTFYEYGFNGYRSGNGIYSVTDVVMQGGILTYTKDEHVIQLGSLAYEKYIDSWYDVKDRDVMYNLTRFKNSKMDYMTYKYINDKFYNEIQYAKVKQDLDKYEIISTDVITLATSFNNESSTGRTYYTILSVSKSKGDTTTVAPNHIPNTNDPTYHFGTFNTSGWYGLVGIKQELDSFIFNKDVVISMEYAYRSPGYHNLLKGKPISPNAYADIGDFYNFSVGVRLDKNNMIKLRYYVYDTRNESTKIGFAPIATPASNVPNSRTRYDSITLHWYLDF